VNDANQRRTHRVDLLSTILLALAAIGTAWSTYQSTQWRGEQAVNTSKATAARIQSSQAATRAGQETQVDIATFIQWVDADVHGDEKLARFYRKRFRKEFRPAFAAWLATEPRTNPKAPLTPFIMPQYHIASTRESERLNAVAGAYSRAAGDANQRADDDILAVVLFATALFFAGISTKVRSLGQREALLAMGWLVFLATAVWLATLPTTLSI
jgi:hypothetical protein